MWLTVGYENVLLLYMATFVPLHFVFRIISYYLFLLIFSIFIFIFSLPSSVNYNVNKTYKILNSLTLKIKSLSKIRRNDKLNIMNKVNFNENLMLLIIFYLRSIFLLNASQRKELVSRVGSYLFLIISNSMR